MADTRTVWLVYQECGEYSDFTPEERVALLGEV